MNHEDKMDAILSRVQAQSRDIEEIKISVSGSTKLGIKGLARRVEIVETWQDKVNLKVAYTAGIVGGITFGGLEGIRALIGTIIHHKP